MDPNRDWLQFDCALSYGLVEYLAYARRSQAERLVPSKLVPHGGHQMSLNIAAGLGLGGNESYPDVFRPFGGFADDTDVVDGHVSLFDGPGIGFEAKRDLFALLRKQLQA